jgi:GDPmannose 4,6-dehydratase
MDRFGRVRVSVDARYLRPAEVETLLGNAARARERLGWRPKTSFPELIAEMADEDLAAAERDELVKNHGYKPYGHQSSYASA